MAPYSSFPLKWALSAALAFASAIFLAAIFGISSVQASNNTATPLTSISVVSSLNPPPDPDDPGIGGGFDAEAYFRENLVSSIKDCTKIVTTVVYGWTKANAFSLAKEEVSPGWLLADARRPDDAGILEFIYRVYPHNARARATVFYYSPDGKELDPAQIRSLLTKYKIADLEDQLQSALSCKANKQ
ncbi:MAG: hypothetical protein JO007_04700 [Alphaproteobacteria bacterium]|nr:hypothetical protein [Alphaproteobacteria bacterium]